MPPDTEPPVPESFDDWLYEPPALPPDGLFPPWAWWLIVGAAAFFLVWALLKMRRRLLIPPVPQDPRSKALLTVVGLKARVKTLPPSEMGTGLATALNRYFQRRYGELAEFRTRDELFDPSARPAGFPPLPPGVSDRFSTLMARCEEMRFAGRKSTADSRRLTIESTLNALEAEPA